MNIPPVPGLYLIQGHNRANNTWMLAAWTGKAWLNAVHDTKWLMINVGQWKHLTMQQNLDIARSIS